MTEQLPIDTMKKAVKGLSYISHPLRLRILEFLDVNGSSSVSAITKGINGEQIFVSQSLKKLRESGMVKTERRGIFIITPFKKNIRQACLYACENYSAI